jgi:hypothetical protein
MKRQKPSDVMNNLDGMLEDLHEILLKEPIDIAQLCLDMDINRSALERFLSGSKLQIRNAYTVLAYIEKKQKELGL